jgi:putative hydrolase of the HAD superfamily
MTITSVVFDYGSVLAWPPSSANCARVAKIAGIPTSVLLDRYFLERSAHDRGTIDDIQYWQSITRGYPAYEDTALLLSLAEIDVEIWSDPNLTTVGWLPKLKDAGLTLALLSNMPESFCTALERRDRWLDIFDHRIFSGRVRLSKPEPAMYQLLLDTINTGTSSSGPENVLFLDDLQANVDGARAVGINAELYNVFDGGLGEIAERYGLPAPEEIPPEAARLRDFACAPHRQSGPSTGSGAP